MKLSEVLLNYILKRGVVYDSDTLHMDFIIPNEDVEILDSESKNENVVYGSAIRIFLRAENVSIRVYKEE